MQECRTQAFWSVVGYDKVTGRSSKTSSQMFLALSSSNQTRKGNHFLKNDVAVKAVTQQKPALEKSVCSHQINSLLFYSPRVRRLSFLRFSTWVKSTEWSKRRKWGRQICQILVPLSLAAPKVERGKRWLIQWSWTCRHNKIGHPWKAHPVSNHGRGRQSHVASTFTSLRSSILSIETR